MSSFGLTEILIILFILFLLFGVKRLPDIARGIGKSIKDVGKAFKEMNNDDEDSGKR
jgi:sec-independent protein translocase protein TatA